MFQNMMIASGVVMEKNSIDFYGIKTHNLKDLNINIIKNKTL